MLRLLREQAKSWFIKAVLWAVVIAFVGTIFLVWGRGGDKGRSENVIAQIGEETFSAREFREQYEKFLERQGISRDQAEKMGLRRVFLNRVVKIGR